MKKSLLILASVTACLLFCSVSCGDDEPFVNIKQIETQVYNEIKAHRESNGKTGNFVHQFVMVKEAQLFSIKQAYSTTGLDTTGISEHWDIIHDKLGGYNDVTLLQSTTATTAADIVSEWKSDTASNAMLLGDYTQCGVGVEYGANQTTFVTVLMMKVD